MGDRAESLVQEAFEKARMTISQTANSGAKNYDGDMVVTIRVRDEDGYFEDKVDLRLEVKKRNTSSFSVSSEYLDLIKKKALNHGGIAALAVVNKENKKLVVLDLEDFISLLNTLRH